VTGWEPCAERSMINLSLTSLIQKLRDAGFSIGIEQILAAEDLLLLMASRNELNNPGRLSTRFAPIFSQNPREQEQFYRLFDEWLNEQAPIIKKVNEAEGNESTADELQDWGRFSDPRLWVLSGLLIALLGFFIYTGFFREPVYPLISLKGVVVDSEGTPIPFAEVSLTSVSADFISSDSSGRFEFLHQQKEQSATIYAKAPEKEQGILNVSLNHPPDTLFTILLNDPSGPIQVPEPLPTSVVELREVVQQINVLADSLIIAAQPTIFQRYYRSYYQFFRAGAILLPLFFLLGWFLLNRYRRRLVLQRKTAREKPLVERLMIRSAGKQLFRNLTFQRTVREMRKHRELASFNLHEQQTIDATLDSGGLFTPIYGTRQASPEYLVLIDRASFKDHQARFVDTLVEELRGEGVFVDRFYFDADARYCYPEDVRNNPVHLFELSARFAQHRLIIFGDARGFFHPVSHKLLPWIELFQGWEDRVLLTPEKLPGWGFREWNIAAQDFRVFPANRNGLHTFIEAVQQETIPAIPNDGSYRPYPKLLDSHTLRWLERDPPRPKKLIRLFDQLQEYLGADGMYWLASCATYPELNWALTLTFGMMLKSKDNETLLNEERLLSISRLPWLRHGYMPNWLRIELLSTLTHEQEIEIRSVLNDILLSAVDYPGTAPLEIVKSGGGVSPRLKGLLRSILQQAEPGTPSRDYVFLSFLSGRQPDQLTPLVPRVLRRFLYRRGYSVLGLRPWFISALTLCLAGCLSTGLWLFPPQQPERPLVPKFMPMENVGDINSVFSNGVSGALNQQERYEYTSLVGPGTGKKSGNTESNIDISNIQPVQQASPDTKLAAAFALSELSFEVFLNNFSTNEELKSALGTDTTGLKKLMDRVFGDDLQAIQEAIDNSMKPSSSGLFSINIRFFLGDVANELLEGYEKWLKQKLIESTGADTTNFKLYLPPVFQTEGIMSGAWENLPCPPFCPVGPLSPDISARGNISGPSEAEIFMMWRQRPIYLLVQQSSAVADPPRTRPVLELPLRSQPLVGLTEAQVHEMERQNGFFDVFGNPEGLGVENRFERRSTRAGDVVVDDATGLMWYPVASDRFYAREKDAYLKDAIGNRLMGYSDWRIPTVEELMTLMEPVKTGRFYLDTLFVRGNRDMEFVWTSDQLNGIDNGYIVQFFEGYAYAETSRDVAVVILVRSVGPEGVSNQNANRVGSDEQQTGNTRYITINLRVPDHLRNAQIFIDDVEWNSTSDSLVKRIVLTRGLHIIRVVSGSLTCSIEGMFLNEGEEFTVDCEPEDQQALESNVNQSQRDPEPLVNLRPTGQRNYTMELYRDFITRLNLWDAVVNTRGGDFPGDFVREQHLGNQSPENTTGTILYDRTSGLRWQSGGTGGVTFSAAQAHLDGLNRSNYGGRSDWRLPTSEEGASLIRAQKNENNQATSPLFEDLPSFWTSDISPENGNYYIQLKDGSLRLDETGVDLRSVRAVSGPVRGLPATAN